MHEVRSDSTLYTVGVAGASLFCGRSSGLVLRAIIFSVSVPTFTQVTTIRRMLLTDQESCCLSSCAPSTSTTNGVQQCTDWNTRIHLPSRVTIYGVQYDTCKKINDPDDLTRQEDSWKKQEIIELHRWGAPCNTEHFSRNAHLWLSLA